MTSTRGGYPAIDSVQLSSGSKGFTAKAIKPSMLRPDIQGLRALAVVAVIADHLFSKPMGGFVGVDVFFVISGFLITGLLIREWQRTGTISFRDFYRRRIRRILPVSLLVIVTVTAASFFLFAMPRFISTTLDALWAALFSANWRLIMQGSDYFAADGPVSPLRHYWSLAVEEQFYFVWPWIMVGALAWLARRGVSHLNALRGAGLVIALVSAVSFVFALLETSSDPGAAYYSSFSRAWELGAGAMLAFASPMCGRIASALRPYLANIGLAGIVFSIFAVSPDVGFPAPVALLPVASTALVIAAGCGGTHKCLYLLTNPVSRYLGDISFSLYLWHFPVIVFLSTLFPDRGYFYTVMALFMTMGLSVSSYRLVEDPIRKSAWLASSTKRFSHEAQNELRANRRRRNRNLFRPMAGMIVFLLIAGGATAVKLGSNPTPSDSLATGSVDFPMPPVGGPAGEAIQGELEQAVKATSWPKFDPSLETLMTDDPHPDRIFECGTAGSHSDAECTFGPADASKTAVLVGDSISQRWAFPLTRMYAENGWKIRIFGRPGCPFNDYPMLKTPEEGASCEERKKQAVAYIQAAKPALVIVGNTMVPERMSSTGTVASADDWRAGMESILAKTQAASSRLILSPPPFDKDVRECYTALSEPDDCLGTVPTLWYDIAKADTAAAQRTGSSYVDTRALFCTAEGLCPAFAGGFPIKKDHTHLTLPYGYHIEEALSELIAQKNSWVMPQ